MGLPPDNQTEGYRVVEQAHAKECAPHPSVRWHKQTSRANNYVERNCRQADAQDHNSERRQCLNGNTDKAKRPTPKNRQSEEQQPFSDTHRIIYIFHDLFHVILFVHHIDLSQEVNHPAIAV
jgi:negative regulator of genetic competence, sporulation and motility